MTNLLTPHTTYVFDSLAVVLLKLSGRVGASLGSQTVCKVYECMIHQSRNEYCARRA